MAELYLDNFTLTCTEEGLGQASADEEEFLYGKTG